MKTKEMNKSENESFYEKHIIIIWCVAGYLGTLAVALMRGTSFQKDTDYLFFFSLLITSPVLGIFWYSLFIMSTFMLSIFWDGLKDKDPLSIFGAFWLGLGLLMLIANTLF